MTEGQWVAVHLPDGSVRQDWVPTAQPPSPDGSLGLWHVVTDQAEPRWEWHPAPPAWTPTPAPQTSTAAIWALVWGIFALVVPCLGILFAGISESFSRRARDEMAQSRGLRIGEGLVTAARVCSLIAVILWTVVLAILMLAGIISALTETS